MAVSQMRRVQILAHSSHRASLIKDLQDLEIIHVNDLSEQEEPAGETPAENEVRGIIRGIENDLSRLQSTIDYLADFEPKKGFVAGLFGGRIVLSPQEYADIKKEAANHQWRKICNDCQSLEDEAASLTNRENRLKSEKEQLRLWSGLDAPMEEIRDTQKTAIRMGVIPLNTYDTLLSDLENSEVDMAFEIVGGTKTELNLVVIFPKEDEQEATSILTRYGFSPVSLPLSSGKVVDQMSRIDDELSEIVTKREDIAEKSAQLAIHRVELMAIYDHMSELLRQEQVREAFLKTEHTFMVDGWVRKKDVKKLEDELSGKYGELEISISEPSEDDEPPVDLESKGPADPFQMVTRLYGIPNYREIDPTPLIAPFFAFFFGICLTDAGYGFVVALIAFLAARKVMGGGRNLFRLLIFAGIATIVVGSITGGWFGIDIDPELLFKTGLESQGRLDSGIIPEDMRQEFEKKGISLPVNVAVSVQEPDSRWLITDGDSEYIVRNEDSNLGVYKPKLLSFLTSIRLLDPQGGGQMGFLKAILAIGFIQVWFGFFIKFYIDIKERDWGAAFLDELPWVLAMILIAVAGFLWLTMGMGVALFSVAGAVFLCWLVIVFFAGRESGNPIARLGTGGFELYTRITGTFGDVLSYLRLFALGLATGIIASVVNTMAGMMWGSPIGKAISIGIFVGGHTFNLVINALGGFIHTARLQFVEFFTKFYEGGGEEFRPLKREHTYVTVVDSGKGSGNSQ